jgi:excisionase family DNA binding protein
MDQQLLSVVEFGHVIGVKDTKAKELVKKGRVMSVKIGDRRLIPVDAVKAFVAGLVAEATL